MKFFVVILAVIGIESIGNYAGHAMANTIEVSLYQVDWRGSVVRIYQEHDGSLVTFQSDIRKGDIHFTMELKLENGEVVEQAGKLHDFCGGTTEAQILRGMLLPKGRTSCPVKEGDYQTRNTNDIDIHDPEWTMTKKCGLYMGEAVLIEDGFNTLLLEFYFVLNEKKHNCKK